MLCLLIKAGAQPDSLLIGKMTAYIVPFPLIDKNPRLRMGFEYHGANHQSYSLEVGYGSSWLNHGWLKRSVWGQDYSFIEIRPEIKWFVQHYRSFPWSLKRGVRTLPRYFALEGYFQEMHDRLEDSDFNVKATGENIAYDEAHFKKIKVGLNLKMGTQVVIEKRILIDFYQGFGLAFRQINYSDVVNPSPAVDDGTYEQLLPEPYKDEGGYFLLQLSLGLRIGYLLNKM